MNKSQRSCAVPSCTLKIRSQIIDVSYHKFPSHPMHKKIKEQWIKIIRDLNKNDNWKSENKFICSRHFLPENYVGTQETPPRLLPTSIPSANLEPVSISPDIAFDSVEADSNNGIIPSLSLRGVVKGFKDNGCQIEVIIRTSSGIDNPTYEISTICIPSDDGSFEISEDFKVKPTAHTIQGTPKTRQIRNPGISRQLFESPVRNSPRSNCKKFKPLTPTSIYRATVEHKYAKSPSSSSRFYSLAAQTLKRKLRNAKLKAVKIKSTAKKLRLKLSDKLKECKHLGERQLSVLQEKFPKLLNQFVHHEVQAARCKSKTGVRYTEEMKKFAVTLHYQSAKAYNFLRQFLTLPHESTLASWKSSANCNPGYCLEVIARLGEARKADTKNLLTDVVVQVDEMAIRKDTVWCPKDHKFVGYVTSSSEIYGETEDIGEDGVLASSALVVLLAGISGGWKVPIGYLFTDKVDGETMFTMVKHGLKLLNDEGFKVHALISDGFAANVSMFEKFGLRERPEIGRVKNVDLKPIMYEDIQPLLTNPWDKSEKFGAIFDMCHELKLWRNFLAQCTGIKDELNRPIEWSYVEKLHHLQQEEGVRAGNKLGKNHVEFQKHKMNVRLAAQSMSSSVADGLDFCRDGLKLDDFSDSLATSQFIRDLDKVFDFLNSSNPTATGYKAPLTLSNIFDRAAFLEQFARRILKFTFTETRTVKQRTSYKTKLVCRGNRHRVVLGTSISVKSILHISFYLLQREVSPFKYIMTYRFSQDLLELLFNKIRGKLGRNNNPNCLELRNIFKNLWHQNWLKSSNTGNCIAQMEDELIPTGLLPLKPRPKKLLEETDYFDSFEDLEDIEYSQFYSCTLAYMTGSVVSVIKNLFKCSNCIDSLISSDTDPLDKSVRLLIAQKDNGGLIYPSQSAFNIVEKADFVFQNIVKISDIPPKLEQLDNKIISTVLDMSLEMNLFPAMGDHSHFYDLNAKEPHKTQLIKKLVHHYLRIRLFHAGKDYRKSLGLSTRHAKSKEVIFNGD